MILWQITGIFLESLNYLSAYDVTTANHLEKVRNQQAMTKRRKGGEKGAKGRSSKLTFTSATNTQNNLINIIGKEIASQIVKEIGSCRAWALIADTTPDVSHHQQLSTCARIVNRNGKCSKSPFVLLKSLWNQSNGTTHFNPQKHLFRKVCRSINS